ncbi:hypothetical protein [Leucobacter massiliensis]|uniref:Large exoprotein n=1 Tax=Leucobacter massiliensis TaxID=1686285 RepID=A0A2S9QPU4_9MICO|nr:hypothetical protein [Leucobacter massiliensis]PRI11610.1 hypothetical protein B4915_05725 [Leucobacter massiliensis]
MTGGVLGGGVIFVVAALLWAAVLVPAWIRRREFRAAERNAARLQRTLRVLAETAEVPREVHVEATAREALAHERLLRTAQKRQEAEREAELAEARAVQAQAEVQAQLARRREIVARRAARLRRPAVRRLRALAALAALVGLLGVLVGAGIALAGSGAAVLVWGALISATAVGGLVLMAPGRARLDAQPAARARAEAAEPFVDTAERAELLDETDAERAAEAHAAAQRAAAERIERARALARARAERPPARENQPDSMLLREAREQVARDRAGAAQAPAASAPAPAMLDAAVSSASGPASGHAESASAAAAAAAARNVPSATPGLEAGNRDSAGPVVSRRAPAQSLTPQQRAARERLRQMGVIGDTSQGMPDLDAALRRRRNAS